VFEAIFTRDSRLLSESELKKAAARLEKLRRDPRHTPRYRDLLLRAELLWKDLPPEGRSVLAAAMDQFEDALASRNPGEILEAFRLLEEMCEGWDEGERW
jgi:molecular chaperone HscC